VRARIRSDFGDFGRSSSRPVDASSPSVPVMRSRFGGRVLRPPHRARHGRGRLFVALVVRSRSPARCLSVRSAGALLSAREHRPRSLSRDVTAGKYVTIVQTRPETIPHGSVEGHIRNESPLMSCGFLSRRPSHGSWRHSARTVWAERFNTTFALEGSTMSSNDTSRSDTRQGDRVLQGHFGRHD
jgi:hypothetical protein